MDVSTSFRTLADTVAGFSLLPRHWTTSGYHEAFHTFNFGRYTLNSAIIAGAITLSNLFLASLGGYAFARLKFPGREVLFMLVLGTLMIPDQLRLVPIYLMLVNWIPAWVGHISWHDASFVNRNGVILIQLVSATSLFLMRQYFLTIPRDLEEAAKLDAAGYFKTYRKVMLPLAGPALAAVGDPDVPGHVERPLLAGCPAAGQVAVHDSDRHRELRRRVPDAMAAAHGGKRARDRPDPRDLRPVPEVLRRGSRIGRGEGMTLRRALGVAASDLYHQAWRLIVLNVLLGAAVVAVVLISLAVPPAVAPGHPDRPVLAAVMHCAVTLAQTEDLRLVGAVERAAPYWRQGIALGAAVAVAVVLGAAVVRSTRGREPGRGRLRP